MKRKEKLKIIFSNAVIKNDNLGCVALSVSMMWLLDEMLKSKGVEYDLYLPDSGYGRNGLGLHMIDVGGKTIKFHAIWDIAMGGLRQKVKNVVFHRLYKESRSVYKAADCILDIGQGDSFADIYGKERFDIIFSDYEYGKSCGIPFCVLPQTVGPFDDAEIRKRASLGLGWAQAVMVRDKQSLEYVQQIMPFGNKVSEIIDVAFFMPYKQQKFIEGYVHVGLNVSSLLWFGGYTRSNQFGLRDNYQAVIMAVLKCFLSMPDVIVHLVPHVNGKENPVENDYGVSYQLLKTMSHPRLVIAPLFASPVDAKGYISSLDFFMGARMHATIGAFSSGVPVVPMAYSRKFNGLFCDTLQYDAMVDLKRQTCDEILSNIMTFYNERDNLKSVIKDRMNGVVEERRRLLVDNLYSFFRLEE